MLLFRQQRKVFEEFCSQFSLTTQLFPLHPIFAGTLFYCFHLVAYGSKRKIEHRYAEHWDQLELVKNTVALSIIEFWESK